MKASTMHEAMFEARFFLKACEKARKNMDKQTWDDHYAGFGNQFTAAVKRASMDLSRKLADLRQGR